MSSAPEKTRVLFVCMGNICRSPTAEAVFRKMVAESPLAGRVDIDSAGTSNAHSGASPDPRAIEIATRRGYDLSKLRARQVTTSDFERFDHVIAMDMMNVRLLKGVCPTPFSHKIELLLDYSVDDEDIEVPDPYYGTMQDFEHTLGLIEEGCQGLLNFLTDLSRVRGGAAPKSKLRRDS